MLVTCSWKDSGRKRLCIPFIWSLSEIYFTCRCIFSSLWWSSCKKFFHAYSSMNLDTMWLLNQYTMHILYILWCFPLFFFLIILFFILLDLVQIYACIMWKVIVVIVTMRGLIYPMNKLSGSGVILLFYYILFLIFLFDQRVLFLGVRIS